MTKNQLLKTIFNLNESWLKEKGFSPDKKTNEFIKSDPLGYQKIQISCAQVGQRFYLTYGLLIRINQLEDLINVALGSEPNNGASILISAVYLKGDINYKQYVIEGEDDIPKINDDFKQIMIEKGFAWFEKYSYNISVLDKELNGDQPIYPEYLQLLMKPIYGIASAKLDNNSRYNEIVSHHKKIWEEKANDHAEFKKNLERIEKLTSHLEKT